MERIHITETPRDAMQGWSSLIPTDEKVMYISALLRTGFDTVDVGSLVSPRAVPQMADTVEVISRLGSSHPKTKLMVVVGNRRGAGKACSIDRIGIIGFPYSTSPTFLRKNINSTPEQAWDELLAIRDEANSVHKVIRTYLSMAFGNPYGDPWSESQILLEVEKLQKAGFSDIVFSDITGEGSALSIGHLCEELMRNFRTLKLGIHLHSGPLDWEPKVSAAWDAGFRYFECAVHGYGGCPMTGYELLGNLDTMKLVQWCRSHEADHGLDAEMLNHSADVAAKIFS